MAVCAAAGVAALYTLVALAQPPGLSVIPEQRQIVVRDPASLPGGWTGCRPRPTC